MRRFTTLAIPDPNELVFGRAISPLNTRQGLQIGGGLVYPEINFTLPTMTVSADTMPEVERHYRETITGVTKRAVELEVPGLVVEFETLPPMTENPGWGMTIVRILLDGIGEANTKHGLKAALRVTPNDTRELLRPPVMRSGPLLETMIELFDRSAEAGAELLSIESVGGKEVHDDALMMCDLRQAIFGMCVMGVRDMAFLWKQIKSVADRHGAICAGDTACGFANTAMVLAEQKMIPRVFAATIRAVSAVRSLVAYECGAVGPGKDCGYENVILKAITGFPMAMEGKTAACAHLSPLGNIAAATADTWSNESVQNVKLLGGMAPVCYLEQLAYDCRLMNQAASEGESLRLRNWLIGSDELMDPQAYILSPASAVRIGQAIVEATDHYHAGLAAAREAIALLREGLARGLKISERELPWLSRMETSLDSMPDKEDEFIDQMMSEVDTSKFIAGHYDLASQEAKLYSYGQIL